MKRQRWFAALIIAGAAVALIYFYGLTAAPKKSGQSSSVPPPAQRSNSGSRVEPPAIDRPSVESTSSRAEHASVAAESPRTSASPTQLPNAGRVAGPDAASAIQVEAVGRSIRDYGNRFGGNPEGTNAEITRALDGRNPKGVLFLRAEQRRLNAEGELLDPWGTPYFFHQLSAHQTEIRSAGPDHKMWTSDDLIQR